MSDAIVFLDFDGVLNSYAFFERKPVGWDMRDEREYFDLACVRRLNRLTAAVDGDIVVSSSWRRGRTLKTLAALLTEADVDAPVIGALPPESGCRGELICGWIRAHERDRAIALDDLLDLGPASDRHVRTDPRHGLRDADVERALSMLRS